MTHNLAVLLDLILAGTILGTNVWFFFVQSPVLVKSMGREKFVPIQMRLAKVLVRLVAILASVLFVVAWIAFGIGLAFFGALVTAVAAIVCHFYVIPKALRAGGIGRSETVAAGGDKSVDKFVTEGSGPSAAFWHRTVVFCVVIILSGVIANMWSVSI